MTHRFKELLAGDALVRVFALGRVIHPVVVDMYGLAGGYHGFWLDHEHAGLTYEQAMLAAVCARANGFDCFVRMAPISYALTTQFLEAGAGGVMAARVESASQAREFLSWAKFSPQGTRGLNTSGRDADYTHKPIADFARQANERSFVAIQIETLGALAEADEIAALDGVDLLFVGPADLSQAMGLLGQLNHDRVWEGIGQVAAACRKHGKHWGTVPFDPAFAERAIENGCRMLTFGNDVLALRRGIQTIKDAYSAHF